MLVGAFSLRLCRRTFYAGSGLLGLQTLKNFKIWLRSHLVQGSCRYAAIAKECKGIPPYLEKVLKEVIRIVNFIKGSALNNRLFDQLWTDMGRNTRTCCFIQKCAGSPTVETAIPKSLHVYHCDNTKKKFMSLTQMWNIWLIQTHLVALIDDFDCYYPTEIWHFEWQKVDSKSL